MEKHISVFLYGCFKRTLTRVYELAVSVRHDSKFT